MISFFGRTLFCEPLRQRFRTFVIVTALLLTAGFIGACSPKAPPPKMKGVPVTTALAQARSIPVSVEAIGTVEAYNSVTVMARVTGQLMNIHFREGQDVSGGDLLMTVDQAPFQEKLSAAQSQLARDKALHEFKKAEADRHNDLIKEGAVSRSEYDKYRTDEAAQLAVIRADEADLEQARLNLSYCTIRAPISGRTGALLLRQGSILEANRTPLVVINQLRPIFVRFAVPEKYLADVKKVAAAGTLRTTARIAGAGGSAAGGKLTFIDNAVDAKTGMITLKAEFSNTGLIFWPGQFVTVQMILATEANAVIIPSQAVQTGQSGGYVFVVDPKMKAQLRPVTVDRLYGPYAVIVRGVAAGETVVTNGQNKLQSGFPVIIKPSLEGALEK